MPIRVLPEAVVSRIAAGEVVERPASVVKEMVENAIDAGATEIKVECLEGGKKLIRITDNGHGIRAEEVELAFAHHATSKLQAADDLDQIRTLGFRGEALASIASVSTLTCVTRHADEASGTLIRIDDGRVVQHERVGRPHGTTMSVENLFGRIPARLKFLKTHATERGRIDDFVTRYAMAYPNIRFTLTHDGRVLLNTTGNGALRDVLLETHGRADVEKMVPVLAQGGPIEVSGHIGLPQLEHANRGKILLFVNGRPVNDVKLATAVVQAYHTLQMVGRYPVAVVLVTLPPGEVDVNAHPAKTEVRFRDANAVFSAVQRAVRKTLLAHLPVPQAPGSVFGESVGIGQDSAGHAPWSGDNGTQTNRLTELLRSAGNPRPASFVEHPPATGPQPPATQPALAGTDDWERIGIPRNTQPSSFAPAQSSHPPTRQPSNASGLPALRILGQLAETYIIAEGPEGLYLIDQHAAHERILFERMLAQAELGTIPVQALLDPVAVQVPGNSWHVLEENLPVLGELGFDLEPFGGTTVLVRGVPAVMAQDDMTAALRELIADLEIGDAPGRKTLEARVLRRVCKRMSIKAGRVLAHAEMQALVRDLEACESPRTCPHGRPTMIHIAVGQLERQFGRLG